MTRRLAPIASCAALLLAGAAFAPRATAADHSETYMTYCALCHGDDGKAQTEKGKEKGARDFTKKDWQKAVSDERIVKSISNGRGKMPSFKTKLSEDDIKALVQEVRAFGKASS